MRCVSHVFAGLPVTDFASAARWYERLLGRPPDRFPHAEEAVWQLTEDGLVYVVRDPARAGHGLLTLIVTDLDEVLRGISSRGLASGEMGTVPGAARTARFKDSDGNTITFGELLAPAPG